jgi:Nuclear transport factor 2 (NTF2) domain
VLLSTVDSVESVNGGIVIQVLGELSNDNTPSQKFAQTFFLAMSQSPVGYYVLNNIFRFLKEDVESDFDDDVEPDSANEIDTAISHGTPLISDALTNGFHPSSHSVASEEDASGPSLLPVLAVPTPLLPERGLESEDLRNLPSPAIEIPADTAPHPPSESSPVHPVVPLEPAPVEPSSTEMETSVSYQAPTVRSQPDEVVRSVEPSASSAPTASTPVVKTWATMAAIKPERIQTEPKAGGGVTPLPKGNGIQALPRKEATKVPSQKGTHGSISSLTVQ